MHRISAAIVAHQLHSPTASLYLWSGGLSEPTLVAATQSIAQRVCNAQPHLRFVRTTEGNEPPTFWEAMSSAPALDEAARNASGYENDLPESASGGGFGAAVAPHVSPAGTVTGDEDEEAAAARLRLAVNQARQWRKAASGRRTITWRARAQGYGTSRVLLERSRAGYPLRSSLDAKAVLIIDAVVCLFVWVGEDASEDDETLAMSLAQTYAQGAARPVQVTHVLAGAEPDEFRRLFHGWLHWQPAPDPHARRRDKLTRRLGLAGRVLRDVAWPGNPATDLRIMAEAAEEVLAGGLVMFSTTCGVLHSTRL